MNVGSTFARGVLALAWLLVPGAASGLETVDEIIACMEANQPERTSIQTISMRSKDRIGSVVRTHADLFWERGDDKLSKIHIRFDDPPDLRNSAILMLEKKERNDVFMYLPELGRTKRVTTHMMNGSMFGTDFTYEDFEVLQGIAQTATKERGDDADVGGRKAFVIVQTPLPDEGSPYSLIRTYVDQETCLATRIEFISHGDQLRKLLEADWDTVLEVKGVWIARRMVLRDQVEESETELEIEKVEIDVKIPRGMFSQSALERRK